MMAHRTGRAAGRSDGRLTLSDFSSIARIYRQTATAQKSAAERLFWMLGVERTDDVLDLGCGTGHLAQEIRVLTDGRVVGIDLSPEMIALAREAAPEGIEFVTGAAEELDMPGQFDAILCNSAFQWFKDEPRALANCFAALRPGGRMAMQAPARHDYCPHLRARRRHARRRPADQRDLGALPHALDVLRDRATSTGGCSPTPASPWSPPRSRNCGSTRPRSAPSTCSSRGRPRAT